jgi:FAD/FMN-containing dehydrogenase
MAIVRPGSTGEVSKVLAACHAARQPVVTFGGLTGLVQGCVASPEEIALSLERMHRIETVDPVDRTMTVEAGAPVQKVQEEAEKHGLLYPVDWGARGSAQIGASVATNAGGNGVIRYGMTRESVLGLEAVLADGTVIPAMNRMIKNNAAYDVKHLFIGSEGTLGVITRLVLRLRELPRSTQTALVAVNTASIGAIACPPDPDDGRASSTAPPRMSAANERSAAAIQDPRGGVRGIVLTLEMSRGDGGL